MFLPFRSMALIMLRKIIGDRATVDLLGLWESIRMCLDPRRDPAFWGLLGLALLIGTVIVLWAVRSGDASLSIYFDPRGIQRVMW